MRLFYSQRKDMKARKILLISLALLSIFQVCFSQEKQSNLVLFDSAYEPNCELLLNRLDYLAVEIKKNPNAVGYIVLYGSSNEVENAFYKKAIIGYFNFRRFDEEYLSLITANNSEKLKIEFWISKDGTKPNVADEKFSYVLPQTNKPILFVRDTIEVAKNGGNLTYFSICECCISNFNLDFLAKFLEFNPNLIAQINIYNKTKKGASKLEKLILNKAVRESGISINRIKTNYRGKNILSNKELDELFDLEVWFIPKVIVKK